MHFDSKRIRIRRWRSCMALMLVCLMQVACDRSGNGTADQASSRGSASAAGQQMGQTSSRSATSADATHGNAPAQETGSAELAIVLAAVVSDDGHVQYDLLDEERLRQSLDRSIERFAEASLPSEQEIRERKVLWINAFNANVLHMAWAARQVEGFENVNAVPGFFDERTITVASERMTLHALRDRLRSLGDPRIHAALVYAAKGSPSLRDRPFTTIGIDRELDDAALQWLEDMRHNRAARDGLWLSPIFEQFADDFEVQPYEGVLGFIRKHARPNSSLRDFVRSIDELRIRHRPFDWTLNQASRP